MGAMMADLAQFILTILKDTPWWVWVLLAYLIFQGTRALRGGATTFLRLSIMPLAFAVWGLWTIFDLFHGSAASIALWALSFAAGIGLGMAYMASVEVRFDRERQLVELPGSSFTLVWSLLIFCIKYALAVLLAIEPDTLASLWFLIADVGITGLIAGMFAGRLLSLRQKYRSTALTDAAVA